MTTATRNRGPLPALLKERSVHALVFLFPVAGVGVRHWFSGIFVLLALISLWDLVRNRAPRDLHREEKTWLWLCAGFFAAIVSSGLVNGWGETQTESLEVDIRYLLAVPLYLLLRRHAAAGRWFVAGLVPAAIYIAGYTYYDAIVQGHFRVYGPYSPNLFGPVAALVALWLVASWERWGRQRWLLVVPVAAALWGAIMSGSRGAYLGIIAMGLVWSLVRFRGWWRLLPVALVLLSPLAAYQGSDRFAQRVDAAVSDVRTYLDRLEQGETSQTSGTAIRFEMWRAGWLVFKDNPVLGAGWGNYTAAVKKYIEQNGLSRNIAHHDHAHNTYVEVLMSLGAAGFTVFLGMLFYPLIYFSRTFAESPDTAMLGILHVVGIAVFSLTDASTFTKGNFAAIFVLSMCVFLSSHAGRLSTRRTPATGTDRPPVINQTGSAG